jgi:hypothetical protein
MVSPEEKETPDDCKLGKEPEKQAPLETNEISEAVRLLLSDGTIEDFLDELIIREAVAFLENPTEDLEKTKMHLVGIGMILAMNYGGIEDQPPVLNEINHRLFMLISKQHIKIIESELEKEEPDTEKIDASIKKAFNYSGYILQFHNDGILRLRVLKLKEQVAILKAAKKNS